jgi:NAD(P)-dependent dehydrogenase (short-subunit alcohol dehydrogenase family)
MPALQASADASIAFTSSSVGRKGRAYWGGYSVSKFAVEGLMQVLADELRQTSAIRVNSIDPGATRTNMRKEAYPAEDPNTLVTPQERMGLYLYLMGSDSKGITGQALHA